TSHARRTTAYTAARRPTPPPPGEASPALGVVSFEEAAPGPPPAPRPAAVPPRAPAAPVPQQLEKALARAGGPAVRRVQVQALPGGKLDVTLTISNADGCEEVMRRLETLPEMAGRQVDW